MFLIVRYSVSKSRKIPSCSKPTIEWRGEILRKGSHRFWQERFKSYGSYYPAGGGIPSIRQCAKTWGWRRLISSPQTRL